MAIVKELADKEYVVEKVTEVVNNSIVVDTTLTQSGKAADAKAVGDALAEKQPVGNYLTSYTETDPTVPAWAKNETKPTYTASEVGADAEGTANSLISTHNIASNTHSDIREEISTISDEIIDIKAKTLQQTPLFANYIEECTDTTKLYVLPDGYIYAYMLTEVESKPSYTNVLPQAVNADGTPYVGTNGEKGYKTGYRINSSRNEVAAEGRCCTGFIAVKYTDTVRFKNISIPKDGSPNGYIHFYKSDKTPGAGGPMYEVWSASEFIDGVFTFIPGVVNDTYPTSSNAKAELAYMRISTGIIDDTSIITINEEIVEGGGTTTCYAWVNTGHAFVPADYEDRVVDLEATAEEHTAKIKELEEMAETSDSTMYISPNGSDNNDGLTKSTPKKTVEACVNAGAKRISAKRGVYKENILLTNISELEIFPTDNDLTHSVGVERSPIIFDTSDTIAVSSLTSYNSIKRVAYSNSANTQFDKVFIAKSQPAVILDNYEREYGSRYNATVWLMSSDEKTVCIKLKPVLTVEECEAETNTFTYVDGYIYVNASTVNAETLAVPTNWGNGLHFEGFDRVVLKEVEVRFSGGYNINLKNCAYFDLYKCACKYTSYGSGFHPLNSNGIMTACYATKNYDGYGISGYGHTTYIDCIAEFNFDDGMSHHNATTGTIIGGRYEGNGKGGNTPAYGAQVNIYGGLYKNNGAYGIGYLWASGLDPACGMVQDAVIIDNPIGLKVDSNCEVTAMDCVYKTNETDKDIKGNLTEVNGSVSSSGNSTNTGDSDSSLPYTNLIPTSLSEDRVTVYNSIGYKTGVRLSGSTGNEAVSANMSVSGFISANPGDILRIKNVSATPNVQSYVIAYNSSNTMTGHIVLASNEGEWSINQFEGVSYKNGEFTVSLTESLLGSGFDAVRISVGMIDDSTIVTINQTFSGGTGSGSSTENSQLTEEELLELIRNWDAPIYDANIPVFLLDTEKAAMTNATNTPDNIYAMYDALMAKHPKYITKTDLGVCTDGVNHVYRYDFVEPEPYHQSNMTWSETKTKAILVSGIHYEWAGIYSLYYALEEIANNPKLYHLRRNTHFIVLPVLNPYCTITANYEASIGVLNANGVQIHRNFEVGFIYPGESGYQEFGTRNHGGTEPLSEMETQCLDNIFKENTDAAFFLTCHNYDSPSTTNGIGFIWPSTATKYMCNMGYRLIDKMSIEWLNKYADELEAGIAAYRTDNVSDYYLRFGHAHVSSTDGTETRQATKYGIQGANIEVCHTFFPHGTPDNKEPSMSSFTMSRGAETYINFLLTACGCYDYKDKKEYSV